MIKIGDRVRFLNAVGGGVVRGFQGKDIVLVEEDDGFETPVLIRECVVIESVNSETNLPEKQRQTPTAQAPIIIREEPEPEYQYKDETPEGEKLTIFLAFVPDNIKQLQTTNYTAFLINDSNYFLHYTVSTSVANGQKPRAQGTIEPNTKVELCEVNKEKLNDWEKIRVQCIAFKTKTYTFKPIIDMDLRISLVRFYKLHSFTENDYFHEQAMLLTVMKNDNPYYEINLTQEQANELLRNKSDAPKSFPKQKKPQPQSDILEIDLHINALLDSTSGMSNNDMLEYQMGVVKKVLKENKDQKGKKIVFIHGKGDGVLRNKILQHFKLNHPNYYVQDASFREYGFGATMVTVK